MMKNYKEEKIRLLQEIVYCATFLINVSNHKVCDSSCNKKEHYDNYRIAIKMLNKFVNQKLPISDFIKRLYKDNKSFDYIADHISLNYDYHMEDVIDLLREHYQDKGWV